jgi:hypothetical protein
LCKLSPEVERILDSNEVYFTMALCEAPVRTLCIMPRVEGGLCLVSVGGKEGVYPRADKEAVLKFAQEVGINAKCSGPTRSLVMPTRKWL